jgi:hypothetical protein
MFLAPVDEAGVQAECDVVQKQGSVRAADIDPTLLARERTQRREKVVTIQSKVPREVVPRPVRDADERDVPLERDGGNGGE